MGKGYKVVELKCVNDLIVEGYFDWAIAVYSWVIKELYIALKYRLTDVDLEVIKFIYLSAYPALGIHYKPSMREENSPETFAQESSKKHFIDPEILKIWEEIEKLVQVTAERLLEERPVSELIQFIGSSNIDWKALTEEIMK